VPRDRAVEAVAAVDGRALKELVAGLADRIPRDRLALLKATLEATARRSLSTRLTVRGAKP
jgi:hypothetical protein